MAESNPKTAQADKHENSMSCFSSSQWKNVLSTWAGFYDYLAWITGERRVLWWELREGEYQEIAPTPDGLLKSRAFPGLWLDAEALLRGDMKSVLATLRHGLDSPEHKPFAATAG